MKTDQSTKVVVILGPTSSGKSDIAIALANNFSGEVISADSRQVFRDLNLGTGKVEGKWKNKGNKKVFVSEGVPHHLIDFRSPRGKYNVSQFQKDCQRKILQIAARGKLPIICGGTGFWISSVVHGTFLPKVEPDEKLRKRLDKKNPAQLFDQLKGLDPSRARSIDRHNKIRLIRAIEICKALGKVPKIKNPLNPPLEKGEAMFEFLQIGIDWPQDKLDQKIKKRLQSRWTEGMINEVENIKTKYSLSWRKIQSFGLAYYWIPLYLQKKIDLKELKKRVFIAERGYAKRQRTWWKKNKMIIWENKFSKIDQLTKKFLKKNLSL